MLICQAQNDLPHFSPPSITETLGDNLQRMREKWFFTGHSSGGLRLEPGSCGLDARAGENVSRE
jgi:hypothetical protein